MSFISLIFIIFLIYIQVKTKNVNINKNTLDTLFTVQNFHNIFNDASIPGILLIKASSHGENYLFAKKTNIINFSITDINTIYDYAQKEHIHNIIILQQFNTFSDIMLKKIKEYNIQIWDQNKINSLIHSPSTTSVLNTSDTSDDNCKIDTNYFNPIQEPSSFLKNI